MVSVPTTNSADVTKMATGKTQINRQGYVPIKLFTNAKTS
jgi:hypothetical protein